MAQKVRQTALERREVLGPESVLLRAAVVLERAGRRDDHDRRGRQIRRAALDVEELFRAEVRAEAGLRDDVVRELEGHFRREHAVAAVRDVCERSPVDQRGRVLERLDEVRLEGVLQKRRHCAGGLEVARRDRPAVEAVGDDHAREAGLHVRDRGRKAEHCHDLARDGDLKAVLARAAVFLPAETGDDLAQLAVVHVHRTLPDDALRVDAELVSLLDVVVEHRGEEVCRRADRVKVAGEVEVDVLHRDDLGIAAAGGPALHAEDRAERRLAQRNTRAFSDAAQAVGEADGRGGFALARRGGRDRRDKNELPVRPVFF